VSAIVLLGSDRPVPGADGSHWKAVEGEPAYRRVMLVEDATAVDPGSFGDGVTVWIGEQIDELAEAGDYRAAGAFLAVGQEPAPGHEVEFNAWMDTEHVPGLGGAPGTLSAHRYRSLVGEPAYFAVYHLRDLDVNKTPEWKRASATPLSAAMKPYARKKIRGLYVLD
jgi:hypothetical protein